MFISILAIIFIFIYSFFFIKKPKTSILAIILLLPSYLIRLNIFNIPATFLELMILGVIFGFIYKTIKDRPDIRFYNYLFINFILLIIALFSVKISNDTVSALGIFKAYFLEPILLFFVIINTFKTKKDINKIINVLGFSVIYLSIYAIFQKITGIGIPNTDPSWIIEKTRRVTSFFEYPNALGLFVTPIVVMFLYKIINAINEFKIYLISGYDISIFKNKKFILKNLFNISVFILGFLSLIFANSEGGIVAVFMSILLIIFIESKNKLNTFLVYCIIGISLICFPLTTNFIKEKVFLNSFSGNIRLNMWQETINMLSNNFISGAGLSNFQEKMIPFHTKKYFDLYLYPHNIILNFWSEIGFFGLITFIIILIIFFRKVFKYKNKDFALAVSAGLAMFSILIHGIVDVPFFKNDLSVLFWVIVSLIIILEKVDDNEIILIEN